MASSEIGNPNSFSAIARLSQSFRHVWNRIFMSCQYRLNTSQKIKNQVKALLG
jgi:hypothetical protein